MDIHEIQREIKKLEDGETTYSACSRLAVLYACENGLVKPPEESHGYSYANGSEFVTAAKSADPDRLYQVLDDHMDIIKEMYPKEYAHVLRLLRE